MPDNYTLLPSSMGELPPSNSASIFDVEDGRILPLPSPTQPVREEVLATLSANEHTPVPRGPDQNGPIIPATNPAQPSNGHAPASVQTLSEYTATAPVEETASPAPEPLPPLKGADAPKPPPPPAADVLTAEDAFVAPCAKNATRTMNACRFILDHGHRLVLSWGNDEAAPGVHVINDNGRLDVGPLLGMLTETARKYLAGCLGLEKEDFRITTTDARGLDSVEGWNSVKQVLRAAHSRLEKDGLVPDGLVVVPRDVFDANLRYMGAPNGVIDLHQARLLSAREVRENQAFVTCEIPDDYNSQATHPAVDIIMPEKPASPEMDWWYRMRGVMVTRSPNREIIVQMNRGGSGKTTIANGDKAALGRSYVRTIPVSTFVKSRFNSGPSSHNGGMLGFRSPVRIGYMGESDGEMSVPDLNLVGGGEGEMPARDVSEKTVYFRPTAHLVIQSNTPEEGETGGVKLKLSRKGGASAQSALRDRLKFIAMPRLTEEEKDPGYVDGGLRDGFGDANPDPDDARRRRQAWVARTVRQAKAMVGKEMPAPLQIMEDLAEERRLAEADAWEKEWLPYALVPQEDPDALGVLSSAVYGSYCKWHAEQPDMDGKPVSKKAIGAAIGATYARSKDVTVRGKTDKFHPGFALNTGQYEKSANFCGGGAAGATHGSTHGSIPQTGQELPIADFS